MSNNMENICRLCLKVVKNEFAKVDEVIKQMFEILLLKLDLDITSDPIICHDCVEIAKMCLNVKSTCLDTERIILLFSIGEEYVKYDIKVIYKENEGADIVAEDLGICRICITQIERNSFVSLDILRNQAIVFAMLPEYMPEMDFTIIENPLICTTCRENLGDYFKFLVNCLDTKRKTKAYCKQVEKENMDQEDLGIVQNFYYKRSLNRLGKNPFKEESNMFDDTACVYPKNYTEQIKQEDVDIKEDIHLEENSFRNLPEMRLDKYNLCEENNVNDDKMYKCSLCAFESKWRSCLRTHLLVHKDVSEITMYKCQFCAYETKQKGGLKRHMVIHKDVSEIIMYKCSFCPYETKRKPSLQNHLLVHKDVSEVPMYKCSLCSYETKHKYSVKRHMVTHKDISEIKTYKCALCAYEAKQKIYLRKHVLVHKNVAKYKCALCAYKTKHKIYIRKHVLVHKIVAK